MGSAPVQEIISFTANRCVAFTGSEIGFVGLISDDDRYMEAHIWSGEVMENCPLNKPIRFPLSEAGLWAEPVRQNRAIIVNDYQKSNPYRKGYPAGHIELIRFMGIPVIDEKRVVAIAGLANRREDYIESDQYQVSLLLQGMWDIIKRKRAEEEIISLNRELEERVKERTEQLEKVNSELEAFAYSVSHDLRAPLRHIDGFINLLVEKEGRMLDRQSRHYMDMISGSAVKMGVLIDSLLSFSRLGNQELNLLRINLSQLVKDAITDFHQEMEMRDIKWKLADLPPVKGDRVMLRIALNNLISNALKFTRTREEAVIEIGYESRDGEVVVFVRDNGVGFDQVYAKDLFGVFHRLHRSEEFEGTGVGLAIAQRIIHRHGGRIWAEAEVDEGATFYFTLG